MPPAADEVCEVIITAPDPDWLGELPRRLVTDRLCASGHNFASIRTIYRWQGQVHDTIEGRVALRTRRSLLPQIVDRAKREYPYDACARYYGLDKRLQTTSGRSPMLMQ